MKPYQVLNHIRTLVRWDHWYESKIPLFFVLGYTLLVLHGLDLVSFLYYIRLLLFAISLLAFGYAINDLSDREIDIQAGKPNPFATLPTRYSVIILVALFLLGFFWLPAKDPCSIGLAVFTYFMAASYSLRPLRFKERGFFGPLVASAAQRTLPALLFFEAFDHWEIDTFLFSVLFIFIGLRWMIGHQLWDLENDLQTSVSTYTTSVGRERAWHLLTNLIFPAEVAVLVLLVLYYFNVMPWLTVLLIFNSTWLALTTWRRKHIDLPLTLFASDWIPLADFYFILWPLSLALQMVFHQPAFWIVFALNILWQHWTIWQQISQARRLFFGREE